MSARGIRSVLLFLAVPALGALAPLLLYPVVTSEFRQDGFAAMAIAQSVGVAIAVVCELGWSVIGPQAVARMSARDRSEYHAASVASKLVTLALGSPVAAGAAILLSPQYQIDAAVIAAASTLAALSPSWALTGVNRPGLLLIADVFPRLVSTSVVALWIWLGGPLGAVGAVNMIVIPFSLFLAWRTLGLRVIPGRQHFIRSREHLGDHVILTLGRSVTTVYTSLIPAFVAVAAPTSVAGYAAADRILRLGLGILGGVPSRLQNWIGMVHGDERRLRSKRSVLYNALLGAIAAGGYMALAPLVSEILFTGAATVELSSALIAGVTALMICMSRGLGLALIAESRPRIIATGNIVAALFGVVAVFLLTPGWGVQGALTGVLVAEASAVVVQALVLLAVWRRPRRAPGTTHVSDGI
ncbi:MAG: oligosaccharide flippase family protein [Microbacterium sp.]